MNAPTLRSQHRCFGGTQAFYSHESTATASRMDFAVFTPPQASKQRVPVLFYLAGLTCTEETFVMKAGAQRLAAALGLMLVAADTSPRGLHLPGEADTWDFGLAASFYLDATEAPWSGHYQMAQYINQELPSVIDAHFPTLPGERGIFGHSMGGHGALVSALKHPEIWRSASAFAPIANPSAVPWGQKALGGYLGPHPEAWAEYDTVALLAAGAKFVGPVRVDVGNDDQFLSQLAIDTLQRQANAAQQPLEVYKHQGYDHGYYFVQSFMAEHLEHHARQLGAQSLQSF